MEETNNCPICGDKKPSDKPNESKGYLECVKCDGAYILEEDESPEDFQSCPYGKHTYSESISEVTATDIAKALKGVASYEYENDYLKFKVPHGLDVSDETKQGRVKVEIYNGNKLVGQIRSQTMSTDPFNTAEGEKTTINGRAAVEFILGSQIDTFISAGDTTGASISGLKMVFWISAVYGTVKNSLVVKDASLFC